MKRSAIALSLASVAILVGVTPARAQYIFLGGGANIPIGDFKLNYKTGWIATAGLGVDLGSKGLWIEAEGWYGSNKTKSTLLAGNKVDLWSALGAVGYDFMPNKGFSPYLLGGAGVLGVKHGDTKFAYTGAFGLGFKAGGSAHLFVEGRLLATADLKMIPVTAGVSIHFGKK